MYDQHIAKWNGRQITRFGSECVAGVAEYEAVNNLPIVWGNANQWINNPVMLSAYDWIGNNPSDPNQLPSRGWIIVWDGGLPGSGGYGHIAFFDAVLAQHSFQSFGQNWGGKTMHFQTHTWQNVAGWYAPKPVNIVPAPQPAPDPAPSNPAPAPNPPTPAEAAVAALPAAPIIAPSSEKYTLIKQLPYYYSSSQAVSQVASNGTLDADTYFIFNKTYPDNDYNKAPIAFNLTTEMGKNQQTWINVSSNVPDPTPEEAKKNTIDEIRKHWTKPLEVTPVTQPILVSQNDIPVSSEWKAQYITFKDRNLNLRPVMFEVLQPYDVVEMDGKTAKTIHIYRGMNILVAGWFPSPINGQVMYRPQQSAEAFNWFGIPKTMPDGSRLVRRKLQIVEEVIEAVLPGTQYPDPPYIETPQTRFPELLGSAAAILDKVRKHPLVFDIRVNKKGKK